MKHKDKIRVVRFFFLIFNLNILHPTSCCILQINQGSVKQNKERENRWGEWAEANMTAHLVSSICVHAETVKNIFMQKYNIVSSYRSF